MAWFRRSKKEDKSTGATQKDPVCGMDVSPPGSASTNHNGHTYYFCSSACQQKFLAQPAQYS